MHTYLNSIHRVVTGMASSFYSTQTRQRGRAKYPTVHDHLTERVKFIYMQWVLSREKVCKSQPQ